MKNNNAVEKSLENRRRGGSVMCRGDTQYGIVQCLTVLLTVCLTPF